MNHNFDKINQYKNLNIILKLKKVLILLYNFK